MIFTSDYAERGITEIVMLKDDFFFGHHDFDKDKTYHDLVGKRDGAYFRAHFSWFEPHKPRPGVEKVPKSCSESATQAITAEEYAVFLKEHGLWGAPKPKAPEAPRCPRCGANMRKRKNTRTGNAFWGCVNFPHCKGTSN